jgi:hypothetical protein
MMVDDIRPIGASPPSTNLPVARNLTPAFVSSLIIAILAVMASVAGLLNGKTLYPNEEMYVLKVPTDLFTLCVGVPILLGAMWLARRGALIGLLCWPGVLLYMLYIYVSYAIGVPFNAVLLLYVPLVALSAYTIIGLVVSIDSTAVHHQLVGSVPSRAVGLILAVLAVLFSLMNLSQIITALSGPAPDQPLELPVWFADCVVVAPTWLIGGWLLWRDKALGFVAGAGLLLLGSFLFVGAIFVLAFPTFYDGSPLDVAGIIFMLVAGMICFGPFAMFARGIGKSRDLSPAE